RFSRDWSSDVCSSDLHPAGSVLGVSFAFIVHRRSDGAGIAVDFRWLSRRWRLLRLPGAVPHRTLVGRWLAGLRLRLCVRWWLARAAFARLFLGLAGCRTLIGASAIAVALATSVARRSHLDAVFAQSLDPRAIHQPDRD